MSSLHQDKRVQTLTAVAHYGRAINHSNWVPAQLQSHLIASVYVNRIRESLCFNHDQTVCP